jgi:hypothetical protein
MFLLGWRHALEDCLADLNGKLADRGRGGLVRSAVSGALRNAAEGMRAVESGSFLVPRGSREGFEELLRQRRVMGDGFLDEWGSARLDLAAAGIQGDPAGRADALAFVSQALERVRVAEAVGMFRRRRRDWGAGCGAAA